MPFLCSSGIVKWVLTPKTIKSKETGEELIVEDRSMPCLTTSNLSGFHDLLAISNQIQMQKMWQTLRNSSASKYSMKLNVILVIGIDFDWYWSNRPRETCPVVAGLGLAQEPAVTKYLWWSVSLGAMKDWWSHSGGQTLYLHVMRMREQRDTVFAEWELLIDESRMSDCWKKPCGHVGCPI